MERNDKEKILEIENVTKYYGSGAVVTKALDGISFDVEKGEFTAIMGASGSGKSTLLNVISTIDRVSCGEIRVEGRRLNAKAITSMRQRGQVHMLASAIHLSTFSSTKACITFTLT